MIQVNELRIGSWVKHNGETIQVKPYHFEVFMNSESKPANAIPLTEEILLKCGYVKNGGWYDSVELKLDIFKDYKFFYIEDVEDHTEIRKPIKHLHQLQNLYFALTGTELKIEL